MLAHIYNAHTGAPIARGEVAAPPEPGDEITIQIDDDRVTGMVVPLPPGVPPPPPGIDLVIPVSVTLRVPAPHLNRRRWVDGAYLPPGTPLPPAPPPQTTPPPARPGALPPERLSALKAQLARLTPDVMATLKEKARG